MGNVSGYDGMKGPQHGQGQEREKKEKWYEDCTPDCTPDCPNLDCIPGCDCGLFSLGWLAVLARTATKAPSRPPRRRPTVAGRAGMAAIHGYRKWLSPRLRTRCRHTPTCSAYGLEAVRRYGLATGVRLIVGRLDRCKAPTPYGTADPVP